jgi:plasmid stabilization system protein ParE
MRVEYSKRAVADLHKISAESRRGFGHRAAEALEARIRAVVDHISREPRPADRGEEATENAAYRHGARTLKSHSR